MVCFVTGVESGLGQVALHPGHCFGVFLECRLCLVQCREFSLVWGEHCRKKSIFTERVRSCQTVCFVLMFDWTLIQFVIGFQGKVACTEESICVGQDVQGVFDLEDVYCVLGAISSSVDWFFAFLLISIEQFRSVLILPNNFSNGLCLFIS